MTDRDVPVQIRAVVFDLDGLMLNTEDVFDLAGKAMLARRGPSDEANIKSVKTFMVDNSMNYPCALITDEVMAQIPDFKGFPTTLFVDHHGKVRMSAVGFHEYGYIKTVVESLLTEQAAERRANTN